MEAARGECRGTGTDYTGFRILETGKPVAVKDVALVTNFGVWCDNPGCALGILHCADLEEHLAVLAEKACIAGL